MDYKVCTLCNEKVPANKEYFYKLQKGKYGLSSYCKICSNIMKDRKQREKGLLRYRRWINNFWYKKCTKCKKWIIDTKDNFFMRGGKTYSWCKSCVGKINVEYRDNNKEKLNLQKKKYYQENREQIIKNVKKYAQDNREKIIESKKTYYYSKVKSSSVIYNNLLKYVDIISEDGFVKARCLYCNKYFFLTYGQCNKKLGAINGTLNNSGEYNFYCSDNCKQSCSTYRQILYPKGFKTNTSREVQPELRKMVLERDEWKCQTCGATQDDEQLHCHHKEGIHHNPIESADIDMCITLCKTCHKHVHQIDGCTYYDMRCPS